MNKTVAITAARRVVLLIKSDNQFKHGGKYALYGNPPRWHLVTAKKPAPKGAPVSAHPQAGGLHGAVAHFDDDVWQALKLPDTNVNAPAYNKALDKLRQWSDAGDVTAILGAGYGTNTYGQKLAKVANTLLAMYGSPHKVVVGQKAGEHAAVKTPTAPVVAAAEQAAPHEDVAPAKAPEPVAEAAPAAGVLHGIPWDDYLLPDTNTNAKTHNAAVKKIQSLVEAGDIDGLNAMASKKLKSKQNYTLKQGKLAALAASMLAGSDGGKTVEPAPEPATEDAPLTDAQKHAIDTADPGTLQVIASAHGVPAKVKAAVEKKLDAVSNIKLVTLAAPGSGYEGKIFAVHGHEVNSWGAVEGFFGFAPGSLMHDDSSTYVVKNPATGDHFAVYKHGGALSVRPWSAFSAGAVATDAAETAAKDLVAIIKWNAGKKAAAPVAPVTPVASDAGTGKAKAGGPKEGDTKQGADGMLVFKNGRWHKVASASGSAGAEVPTSTFIHNTDGHNKFWSISVNGSSVTTTYGKIGSKGSSTTKEFSSPADAQEHVAAITTQKLKKGYVFLSGSSGPAPAAVKKGTTVHETPAGVEAIDGWKIEPGTQGGYTDGAFYVDPGGQRWYCKFHGSGEEGARTEVLAMKLYEAAGCDVPTMKLVVKGGKFGTASKVIEGLKKDKALLQSGDAHAAFAGFVADCWLANWDTVGNNPAPGRGWDNIQFGPDGKAYRIDAGGALHFKGTGAKKGDSEWTASVIETGTMLDPGVNAHTAKVFGKMGKTDVLASAAKVIAIPDTQIAALVKAYGAGSVSDKNALIKKLVDRKNSIASQYPEAVAKLTKKAKVDTSWVKLNAGEKIVEAGDKLGIKFAKIEVPAKGFSADGVPKPSPYTASSSKFVNAANTADMQKIYDTAVSGVGPAAVHGLKFEQIDKATGEKTGKLIGIDEHPSKAYVLQYMTDVVAELKAQLKPTFRTAHSGKFASSYQSAAEQLSVDISSIGYAEFKGWQDKAADYLVLDRHSGSMIPPPPDDAFKNVDLETAVMQKFKAQSDKNYAKLSESEKAACKAYTGSAYWDWNAAMRRGDITSHHFKSGAPMRDAFEKAAVDLPAGIILHRGIDVGGDTYKSVVGAVIQDGSFQSCSYGKKAAFSGKTSQLRLHVTKGVKAVHATTFSHFSTAEREVILHPNCRYLVLKVEVVGGKNVVDVLVLPH